MVTLRKVSSVIVGAALMSAMAVGVAAETKFVAVTAIVDHPALDAVREGALDELKAAGFEPGKNLKWEYQSAQGNAGTAGQIGRKFVGSNPDVIIAIATPSAQPIVAATKSIPVVFSAIADPIAAQLVKDWKPSKTNVTGLSNMLDPVKQADFVKSIVPNAKRIGIVYNPGEANSVSALENLKAVLEPRGVAVVSVAAPRTVDVGPAAKSLLGRVDALYSTTDNNVMATYEALVKVANDAKLPLISSDPSGVSRGASAGLGIDFYQLGRETGQSVVRILNGEKAGDIAPSPGRKLLMYVNTTAAQKQGVTLPADVTKNADKVFN
jgi:putative ABC transport system substrate-binding protein